MDLQSFLSENPDLAGVTAKDIKVTPATPLKNEPAIVGKIEFNPSAGNVQCVIPFHYPAFAPEGEQKTLTVRINAPDASWFGKYFDSRTLQEGSKEQMQYRMGIARFYKPLLIATGTPIEEVEGKVVSISARGQKGMENVLEVSGIYPRKS